ncbi:hypothetical protein [Hyalangium gracile]|uniref:hypothetical protein n=1 Tax=Hyalangium gracile TaxID=394092 RepID=UPI001CCA0924|nr:hypothetical protein [Hyalangium gracile]
MRFLIQRAVLAVALAVSLLLATPSEACGPDCGAEESSSWRENLTPCVEGRWGNLASEGPGCRVLGFLWMRGMTPADQQLIASSIIPNEPYPSADTTAWTEARTSVAVPAAEVTSTEASIGDIYFANCLTGAFQQAAKTLNERIAKFGAESPEVADWTRAQDAVFAHCADPSAAMPEPASSSAPPLIRADRAYQLAAALFYSGKFDEAIQELDRIATDAASPWKGWARLVAVRAVIRKSTLSARSEEEKRGLLEKARERCVAIVKDASLKDLHRQTRQLTWFIDYRLRPDKQLSLLGRVLLEKPDANFGYALRDYLQLRRQGLPATDELSTFLEVFEKKEDAYPRAVAQWKKSRSLPWLVAALSLARGTEPELPELLAQSEAVPKASPAYVAVHAQRGRLALAAGKWDAARAEVLPLLAAGGDALPWSTAQPLSDILRESALTFDEWAKYAHLSGAMGGFFSRGVPLARFTDPKMLEALNPHSRAAVVLTGWVRAVLLDRWDEEKALEPFVEKAVPELVADLAKVKARKDPDERKMAAVLLMLKSPGLSAPGLSRTAYLREYDSCGGNGWCAEEATDFYQGCDASKGACGTRYIPPAERRQVLAEREALAKLGKAPELLIRFTLDYAKRHPNDALVPEALHESVRQTRFARNYCGNSEEEDKARTGLSKQAFQLLQRKYAKTEWAKKTPYHY